MLIENEYGISIKNSPYSPGSPQANSIIDIIYQVIVNLVHTYNIHETYVDDAYQWMGILVTTAFAV